MDVYIDEMSSTVHTTDSSALLNPQVIERLLQMLVTRLKEQQSHEHTVREEQKMRPSMTARSITEWE